MGNGTIQLEYRPILEYLFGSGRYEAGAQRWLCFQRHGEGEGFCAALNACDNLLARLFRQDHRPHVAGGVNRLSFQADNHISRLHSHLRGGRIDVYSPYTRLRIQVNHAVFFLRIVHIIQSYAEPHMNDVFACFQFPRSRPFIALMGMANPVPLPAGIGARRGFVGRRLCI